MILNILHSKWEDISSFQNRSGYQALRISSECIPELFIAMDVDGYRCLLLFLPEGIEINLKGSDKEKLQITYNSDKNVILIKLNDLDFVDLFNDLILSLYSKINKISSPKEYAIELIHSFYKWVEFFEDSFNSKLSREEIQGLFGELFILRNKILEADSETVNELLDSWKGPYDNTNDFVFDNKNVEVKTKKDSKPSVKISSEFQLEKEFDKGLELLIVSVIVDLTNGESIYDLLTEIVRETRCNLGDLVILYRALNKKSLTVDSTIEYNNHRFKVVRTSIFDCTSKEFPKLSVSNIPEGITKLNYNLRTSTLSEFLIEEKIY
jgi:hypothetical protein